MLTRRWRPECFTQNPPSKRTEFLGLFLRPSFFLCQPSFAHRCCAQVSVVHDSGAKYNGGFDYDGGGKLNGKVDNNATKK